MKTLPVSLLIIVVLTVSLGEVKFSKNRTHLPLANFSTAIWNFKAALSHDEGKMCLRDVDKCIEEDPNYEATTDRLANYLLGVVPPFDLSQMEGVSPLCRKQSAKYVEDLKKFKLWALKMYDSSAKWPSGILNGNVNQLGDFDMCLQAVEKRENIYGQYCLAAMQVEAGRSSPYVLALHRLVQSHFHFKSRLNDPGHRVPRFSSINWAVCTPNSCTPHDIELALKTILDNVTKNTDLKFKVLVDPRTCHFSQGSSIPHSTILVSCVFLGIMLVAVIAAVYDYYSLGKNQWILAFSLRKNFNSLKTLSNPPDDIETIHGIRFGNAYMLVLAHKSLAMFFTPYVNRTEMVEFVAKPWTVLGRAASLYTDPFLFMSGILTTYSLLKKLKKNGRINLFEEYASRLLRILPSFAAIIAFCTFVLPWLSSGPMWNQVVTHHSHLCKKYWWRNFLFIHNYFGFNEMCLTHTHHVGIDTQLFFVSPLLVWLLWKWSMKGAVVLSTIAVISTVMRYYITYSMNLSNYIHYGTSIQQLFATADYMYAIPPYRATVYIMGVLLGWILINNKHISLSKSQARIGTFTGIGACIVSFFSPAFMGDINYTYNPTHAAWYAAFSPIFYCWGFGWVIFSAQAGYKGFFQKLASWRPFRFWTKISYTVYLVQFPVFFFNVGITRSPQQYGFFSVMLNLQEQVWVFFLATLLTLFVEMPFQNIRNVVFKKPHVKVS